MGHDNPDKDLQPQRLVPRRVDSRTLPQRAQDRRTRRASSDMAGGKSIDEIVDEQPGIDEEPEKKETNPKDAVGIAKVPMSTVPLPVLMELGAAMMEGARKYGRHNYRVAGVRGSVYFDATMRHMFDWWEGEDIDPDSGLSHITKAIATLTVLRDSMIQENWVDDRPPKAPAGWLKELNKRAAALLEKYPDAEDAYIEGDQR